MTKWILSLFMISGCASAKHISSGSEHLREDSYQKREILEGSFLKTESHNLSDNQIAKLLNSKIKEKKSIKLAFADLGHLTRGYSSSSYGYRDSQDFTVSSKNKAVLAQFKKDTQKVKSVSFIPSFLIPSQVTIANLRDAAALIQADYLVIIHTNSSLDDKVNLFNPNEAQAIVNMEVAMMDVATGAMPFTSLVTGRSQIEKNDKEDFNSRDFMNRALDNAQSTALLAMTLELHEVLDSNLL